MPEPISDERLAELLDDTEAFVPPASNWWWDRLRNALRELQERRAKEADDLARQVAEERSEDGCGCD